jgi:hypothetical protein
MSCNGHWPGHYPALSSLFLSTHVTCEVMGAKHDKVKNKQGEGQTVGKKFQQ